jgi:5-methyltetrahydrofolate--homocysteine methyltransferase
MLLPYGDLEPDAMRGAFERQLGAVLGEGVDVVCVETMTDLNEAQIAIQTARRLSPDTPIMATMTFDPTPRGFFTVMGVSVEQAAHGLAEAGADIVGSNCGNGIENMIKIAAEFRKHTDLPLIIQSNAGLPEMRDGQAVYTETPDFMAEQARQLLDIGVQIIGGCCGTTPDHIRALCTMVGANSA